jgi:hypothetical protein
MLFLFFIGLNKHAGIDGKKLNWDLQVNSNAVSVKLVWIKAGKPVDKTGETTSQAPKKKRNVDGLDVTVVLVCLRCFICRGVNVGCLCLYVSTLTPLQMKQRKQTSTTATLKPSTFQQY